MSLEKVIVVATVCVDPGAFAGLAATQGEAFWGALDALEHPFVSRWRIRRPSWFDDRLILLDAGRAGIAGRATDAPVDPPGRRIEARGGPRITG